MKRTRLSAGLLAALMMGAMNVAMAQAPGGNPGAQSAGDPAGWGTSANNGAAPIQEQMKQLGDYLDKAKAFDRKTLKQVPQKEIVLNRVKEVIDALKLSCAIKDAELVGNSSELVGGKAFQRNMYEVACSNNMGYFLSTRDRYRKDKGTLDAPTAATSVAITCLSAEAVKEDDNAKGLKSELYCQLPDNGGGDIKVMTNRILSSLGVNCGVKQFQWFGVRTASNSEIVEAACDDGKGYLLQTALPGGSVSPSAINCVEASRNGLDCKLTKVAKLPTLQTFKDYLANTDVKCKVDSFDQMKVLGKESTKHRYIVEFKCAQQPNGLVALIPLEDNPNKFETMDCSGLKKYGIACKLTAKN